MAWKERWIPRQYICKREGHPRQGRNNMQVRVKNLDNDRPMGLSPRHIVSDGTMRMNLERQRVSLAFPNTTFCYLYNSCKYLQSTLEFEKWLTCMFLFDLHPYPVQIENGEHVLNDFPKITHKECREVGTWNSNLPNPILWVCISNAEPRTMAKLVSKSHVGYNITIFVA